jgi:lysozyme
MKPMTTSQAGVDLIKKWEGFRATMYLDAVGKPTIGYGTLIDKPEEQYLRTATITQAQAEELLRRDLVPFEQAVNEAITVRLTQNQFDALVSFVYNLGPGTFRNGSLPRLINQRSDALAISAKWREYRMAGGRVLQGLVNRRRDELFLYWRHLWSLAIILFFAAGIMLTASAYTMNA